MIENPSVKMYPNLYDKCKECAKADPAKYPNRNGWMAFGCHANHNCRSSGGCDGNEKWPGFVQYEPPVKVGDHVRGVRLLKATDSTLDGLVGVVEKMEAGEYLVKLDEQPKDHCSRSWWYDVVEVIPAALNGCEQCSHCPKDAKIGDKCPYFNKNGDVGLGSCGKDCIGFVQKSCSNCGRRQGCISGKISDCWVPRKAEPLGWAKVADNINKAEPTTQHVAAIIGDKVIDPSRKSGAAGNIAPPEGTYCPMSMTVGTQVQCWQLRESIRVSKEHGARAEKAEKERDELKAKIIKDDEWHEMAFDAPYIDVIKNDRTTKRFWNEAKVAAAEARAQAAEAREKAEHESFVSIMTDKKGRDIPADAKRCPGCGTEFAIEEPVMEPHVPKWASQIEDPECRKCKNARWWLVTLGVVATHPCYKKCMAETYDEYEPRYTRSQRRWMSMAGKLKAARNDVANQKYLVKAERERTKELRTAFDAIVAKKDAQIAAVEQKGIEAVAHTAEVANKKLKEKERDFDLTVQVMGEKLKASVPLANAIPIYKIHDDKHEVANDGSGEFWQTFYVVTLRGRTSIDPRDVVLYKKPKEEK